MQKTNRILRTTNEEKIYYYDSEIYVKPIVCNICKCKFNNKSKALHLKTEHHKIAVHLQSFAIKPIEDIQKAILQYKMINKFMKRTFNSDSSSSTIETNNDSEENKTEEIDLEKIKHKTDVYARNLAHRAERYERTKSIDKLVNTIKNSKTRLSNLQKDKYYYLLNKYPENETLLSIKNIVPPLTITYVKEPKIKEPKIKHVKKKLKNIEKVYPIIKYEPIIPSNIERVSYPIVKYKDKTTINTQPTRKTVYEIIKYE
jgi:hypothetical protein